QLPAVVGAHGPGPQHDHVHRALDTASLHSENRHDPLNLPGLRHIPVVRVRRRDVAELHRRDAKRHAASVHARAREMQLGHSGRAHQGRGIIRRDATSGQHPDAAGRLPYQPGDRLSALGCGGRLTGAEHALHPERDERLQRAGRVAAHVEGAVKGDVQRPCGGDELAGSVHIDLPVGSQHARHDAVRAGLLGSPDVLEHDRELGRRVEEVSAARPDEHEDRDVEPRPADRERARGGRRAALDEVGAQLEAVGAAARGGERRLDGVDAGFDEDGSGHAAKIIGEFLLLRAALASIDPMTARPDAYRYFARLAREFGKPGHVWLFDRYPTYSFYRFDDRAVIALYSNTSAKKELPAFEITASGVLGKFLAADMDDLETECRQRSPEDLEVVIANAAP